MLNQEVKGQQQKQEVKDQKDKKIRTGSPN